MPGMDGLTAATMIREREQASGGVRIPIVAVTASVLSHETARYFAAGMDDFIAKPIEVSTLIATMNRVAANNSAAGQAACGPVAAGVG